MRFDGFWLAAAIGTTTFVAALGFQYLGGLYPCQLCISQRWALGIGIGGAALAAMTSGKTRLLFGAVAVGGFLAELGLAVYHTGVERGWWKGPETCSGGGSLPTAFDPAVMLSEASGRAPAACNEIPWELFGLSMANYNVFIAAAMAGLCVTALRRSALPSAKEVS